MIWHVVRFHFGHLSPATRVELEEQLADLAHLDVVGFVRVARDLSDPDVTGLIVGLEDEDALAAYHAHPGHHPVVRRIRELDVSVTRLDLRTADPVGVLS